VRRLTPLALAVSLVAPATGFAETFRLQAPDGTVHFTNVPTDPQYRRQGMAPPAPTGTQIGWLRLPKASVASYAAEIRAAAERHGLPEHLVSAVIRVESGFNPRAVSHKGARGLMQLMPATAAMLGVRDSFDPRDNIEGGVRHLRGLIDRFNGDVPLALAAYNAGENAVLKHRGIPPYQETQDYVTRVMRHYATTAGGAPLDMPSQTFRKVEADGTVVYTNIPPRGRL
jgi:soluble lytic murein transglycosylase